MELPLIVAVSLALVATYVVRQVLAFWARLDKDSSEGLQLQIEDPSSIKPLLCPSIWGTATKRLSVVVPAYNEEDRLPATLDETLAYLQRRRNKEVRM
jgi:dolichyl-phosphate beta-glucosyltransferase